MSINIIQGADKIIIIRLNSDTTGDPFDLTDIRFMRACFLKANGQSLYVLYLGLEGDLVFGSDIISNIDTTNITEGMPVTGPGIQADTVVIKTPASLVSPTAPNTIQISNPAQTNGTALFLEIGQISILNAPAGKIQIHLEETDTDTLKVLKDQSFEIKIVKDNFTSYIQFLKSYTVLKRIC